jgi:prepilin-type N-terminal cleavage/methylation domain-containing protein
MARTRLLSRFKRLWHTPHKRRTAGFTLIELLVSMVVGAIIVVALLSLVVELTDANQKDAARTATQREMQAAMDYIVQDLREAVYVYDGRCLSTGSGTITDRNQFNTSCPPLINHLPDGLSSNGRIPVLAFWRTDPLPEALAQRCRNTFATATTANPSDLTVPGAGGAGSVIVPCLSGKSYSLVVYTIADNTAANNPNSIWRGRARLERYALTQFDSSGDVTPGYAPPLPTPNAQFFQWPFSQETGVGSTGNITNMQGSRPTFGSTGNPQVLVDYLDDAPGAFNSQTRAFIPPVCPNPDPVTINTSLVPKINVLTPSSAPIRSFYVCVRGNTIDVNQKISNGTPDADRKAISSELAINQEVRLVLQGNVSGRPGFPRRNLPADEAAIASPSSRLTPIETLVLIRGAVQKNPG